CAGERRVGHQLNGKGGDVGWSNHPPNGERRPQFVPPGLESPSEKYDADSGVSTKPAAIRLTRTGASWSARAATNGGSTATAAEAIPRSRLIFRPPVPPISSSVPPDLIFGAAFRATSSPKTTWSASALRTWSAVISRSGV